MQHIMIHYTVTLLYNIGNTFTLSQQKLICQSTTVYLHLNK